MNSVTKTKKIAVTQAKVIRANGDVEYHYSLPKIPIWDIKGMCWLWRRLNVFKEGRKLSGEKITKIIYH